MSSSGAAPRISIIINMYNGEKYLAETIDNVLAQTFTDWELICWDDVSTDGGADICKTYKDPRIRYVLAAEHGGIGQARNLALREARAPWLAFLDQDDLWTPEKLAKQHALIEADTSGRLGLVYGRTMRFDARGRERDFDPWHEFSRLPAGNVFEELLRRPSFISLSSALLRKTAIEAIGGIPADVTYCPDYYLFVMLAKDHEAACVQETCCRYRVHDTNMSKKYIVEIHAEILGIVERFADCADPRIIRARRKIHNSLIGWEELKTPEARWRGLARILREGSVAYLALRPGLSSARALRRMLHRL